MTSRSMALLAGAGILGFAIPWSFQTLMKDLIMGGLILLEDQSVAEDVITIGDMDGFVKNPNGERAHA